MKGFLLGILFSLILTVLALTPFWLWYGCYHLLSPDSFLEKLLVIGFGAYFLGAIQFMLLIVLIAALCVFWEKYLETT